MFDEKEIGSLSARIDHPSYKGDLRRIIEWKPEAEQWISYVFCEDE